MAEFEFFLVPEVATKLRVSTRTVYRLISSHQLAATRVGCGQGGLRVTPQAVSDFIERRQQFAAQPA